MAQPLVKRNKEGELYTRRTGVEAAIDAISLLSDAEFFRRLPLPVSNTEQFQSECLVHFLRDAWTRKNNHRFGCIFEELLKRCRALSTSAGLHTKEIEIVLDEFATFLADELCETTKHKLDYYECSFNSAFMKFRISKVSRKRKAPVTSEIASGDAMTDGGMEAAGALCVLFNQADRAKPPDELLADKERDRTKAKVLDAIELLPKELREVITLRHVLGYQIYSGDRAVETVAKKCGISEKGVHDRLNRAYTILKTAVKEDEL